MATRLSSVCKSPGIVAILPLSLPDFLLCGALTLALAIFLLKRRDVPALAARVDRLEDLSSRDLLTGLLNGHYLEHRALPEAMRACFRTAAPLTLAFVDLDQFGLINKHSGHAAGDLALRRAAAAMRVALRRRTDLVFRYYRGDEFVLLLPDADATSAQRLLADVLTALNREHIHASIGAICVAGAQRCRQAELLRQADALMRRVKADSGSAVAVEPVSTLACPESAP